MEDKKSIGKQVLDRWGKEIAPETREVTNESWWKTFHPRLKEIVEKHKPNNDIFYIMLSIKTEGILGANVKHATWLIFDEIPPPKENSVLWRMRKSTEELHIEWCLPDEDSMESIMENPKSYDRKLVDDCKKYLNTKKIKIKEKNLIKPTTKVVDL